MATTSVRWAAVEKLVQLIAAHDDVAGVGVHAAPPGDLDTSVDLIFVQAINGAGTVPAYAGGRTIRDDNFTITVLAKSFSTRGITAVMERVEVLGGILEDVVADNDTLGDLDGVVAVTMSASELIPQITPEGAVGYASYDVNVHARLT